MFEVYGGTVGHAGEIIHGKQSDMVNDGKGLFKGLPKHFKAIRYHSLVINWIDENVIGIYISNLIQIAIVGWTSRNST